MVITRRRAEPGSWLRAWSNVVAAGVRGAHREVVGHWVECSRSSWWGVRVRGRRGHRVPFPRGPAVVGHPAGGVVSDLGIETSCCWVVAGRTVHVLAREDPSGLVTHCRQRLPARALRHERLPGLRLCPECVLAYLLPVAVFTRHAAPSGQPVPDPPTDADAHPARPRWAHCPEDEHLHLLTADQAQTAGGDRGHGHALCGQVIPAAGLTLVATSAGLCLRCLAMTPGTSR